jgi:hypothetical protein
MYSRNLLKWVDRKCVRTLAEWDQLTANLNEPEVCYIEDLAKNPDSWGVDAIRTELGSEDFNHLVRFMAIFILEYRFLAFIVNQRDFVAHAIELAEGDE